MTSDDAVIVKIPVPAAELKPQLKFRKVRDSRGHQLRGLWQRGARFYSQMTVIEMGQSKVKKVPLKSTTVAEAIKERYALLLSRDKGTLEIEPKRAHHIAFSTVADEYSQFIVGRKDLSTVSAQQSIVRILKDAFPAASISIGTAQVQDFISDKLASGLSNGTINKYRAVLNQVMAYAKSRGHIPRLPQWELDWLEYEPNPRRLLSSADIDEFCAAAIKCERPQAFVDFIRLLAYCGGRKNECMKLVWSDVLWDSRTLHFRPELTKNSKPRHVNFNPKLDALLRDMQSRRLPDSEFLFPSPWDVRSTTHPRSSFWPDFSLTERSMEKCTVPDFHTLRHYFISMCVMAGVDFMTIASWVGHQDGGVLIGKVYGHLNDSHKENMAGKLNFA